MIGGPGHGIPKTQKTVTLGLDPRVSRKMDRDARIKSGHDECSKKARPEAGLFSRF
jgi:hypothetical protein